jgi:alpha-beta hydrolase superfamily lysophospholipase
LSTAPVTQHGAGPTSWTFFADNGYRCLALSIRGTLNRPKPDRVTTRLLVLGAEQDACITRAEVDATARAYGTDAEFFDMGHDMMLEPGWAAVAERICAWLGERGL